MQLGNPMMDQRTTQQAKIRRLVEQVQLAVRTGKIKFDPQLDRRNREQ
jgi:hypothetical protein